MKGVLFLLTLLVYWAPLASLVSAQEPSSAPRPDRLSADWWSYFISDDLEAEEATNTIKEFIQELEENEQNTPLIQSFTEFLTLRDETSREEPKNDFSELAADDLEGALKIFRVIQRLETQKQALSEDRAWQDSLVDEIRRNQLDQRAKYLASSPADPNRKQAGLNLMTNRVRLETRALEVEKLKIREKALGEDLDILKQRLEEFKNQYSPTEDELAIWREKISSTNSEQEVAEQPAQANTPASTFFASRRSILLQDRENIQQLQRELNQQLAQLGYNLISSLLGNDESDRTELTAVYEKTTEVSSKSRSISDRVENINTALIEIKTDPDRPAYYDDEITAIQKLSDEVLESRKQMDITNSSVIYLKQWLDQQLGVTTGSAANQVYYKTRSLSNRLFGDLGSFLRRPLFEVNGTPVDSLGILRLLFIVLLALVLSRFLRHGLDRFGAKQKRVSKTSLYSLQRLVHYLIIALGLMIGLSSLGLDFTKFAIFASALGIGLGFGFQTMASNFVAGLILLFEKSLNVGDFVELESGIHGEVREINMRSTLVTTNDNVDIIVPNSEFVSNRVTNWTLREAYRRIRVPFGVAYGTDKELVRMVVLEAAEKVQWTLPQTLKRSTQVWLVALGDSSIDFELVVWLNKDAVKRPSRVKSDYLWEIESCLNANNIEIPFPQRDLRLRNGFSEDLDQSGPGKIG